jgi:hypothetical protein
MMIRKENIGILIYELHLRLIIMHKKYIYDSNYTLFTFCIIFHLNQVSQDFDNRLLDELCVI